MARDELDVLIRDKEENKVDLEKKCCEDIVKTKIEKISCEDLENKFILVRVGNNDRPAVEAEMKEVKEELDRIFDENGINCLLFVTHHAISIDIIEKRGV